MAILSGRFAEHIISPLFPPSAAAIVAVSRVESIKTVRRFTPFHRTAEPEVKAVPVTVSVSPALPATTEVGASLIGSARYARTPKSASTMATPMNPSSSPMGARMKSLWPSGM